MTHMKLLLYILLIVVPAFGEVSYPPGGDVIELSLGTFDSYLSSNSFSVVQFYSPICRVCHRMIPKYKQAAFLLKDIVRFLAVDCVRDVTIGKLFSIKSYPTIAFFKANETDGKLYKGNHQFDSLMKFVLDKLDETIAKRVRDEANDWSLSLFQVQNEDEIERNSGCKLDKNASYGAESFVINLTEDSFNKLVLKSEALWMVEFYVSCCSKCRSLKSHWEFSAETLKRKMKLGAVNADVHRDLAKQFSITDFPAIKFFAPGSEIWHAQDFTGGMWSDSIIFWANNVWSQYKPPPEIVELTNSTVLEEACYETRLCIVAVLPKLSKCDSKCRKKHLALIKAVASRFEEMDWGWIWTESETHLELEEVLELEGYNLPAILGIKVKKNTCKILLDSLNTKSLTKFIRELVSGKGPTLEFTIGNLPTIETISAWDGQDDHVSTEKKNDFEVKDEL